MARPVKMITASKEARAELQRRAKAPTCVHRDRFRANIILLRLEGLKIESVAKRLKTSMATVSTWSARFETDGLDGLNDKVGRGRQLGYAPASVRLQLKVMADLSDWLLSQGI